MTPAAANPRNLYAIIKGDHIDPKTFKQTDFLLPRFMDNLRNCVLVDNMGLLATQPPSFVMFFSSYKIKATEQLVGGKKPRTHKQ